MEVGSEIFVAMSSEADAALVRGCITDCDEKSVVVTFDDRLHPVAGDGVELMLDAGDGFCRYAGRVRALLELDPKSVIAFVIDGDPESADDRDVFRISLAAQKVTVLIDQEDGCEVLDISADGMAAVTRSPRGVGDTVAVCVKHDGKSYRGTMVVQHCAPTVDGFRCGLETRGGRENGDLKRGMQLLGMAAQRAHLRRRAGA